MANYFSLRDGLITDTSTYGISISSVEKTNNTRNYMLSTTNSWSTTLTDPSSAIIDSIAVHLSSRSASPTGTLTLEISSRTTAPTTFGTYPISSFTSYDGSDNTVAAYPLNWQLLKLSTPFTNSTGSFKFNLKTSDSNQLSLMALSTVNGIDYDRMVIKDSYTATSSTDLHICSVLNEFTTENRTVTANTGTFSNVYVHNGATLTFSDTTSSTLTLTGANGLQATSDGTVQVGTSANPVPKDITHSIVLSNNQLGVSNGGRLDVYGAYKVPYTKLNTPSLSTARVFTVTDSVSSNWSINDTVVFTPNTAVSTSYDTLILSSFDSDNTFRTTASAQFAHSTLSYVPNVANLTRNVKIGGASYSAKGNIQAKGSAKVNVNNAEFRFIDTSSTTGVDNNGYFLLSGCALSGTGTEILIEPTEKKFSTIFNGTNSYLLTPTGNSDFDVNAGTDFTLEFFIKISAFTNSRILQLALYPWTNLTDLGISISLAINAGEGVGFRGCVGSTSYGVASKQSDIILNKWNHIAVVAKNSVLTMYVNGKKVGKSIAQFSWNYTSSYRCQFGREYKPSFTGWYFPGRLSNFRFVKGFAVYTENFTPPLEPLTAITGSGITTALLTFQGSPVVDNSYRNASLTLSNITTELDSPFGKDQINASINKNVLFKTKYGIKLDNATSQNATMTNNLILSSKDAGMYIDDGLKGSISFSDNIAVGPSPYGSFLQNNTTGNTLSGLVNYNNTRGVYINNSHSGDLDNIISTHNSTQGIYVDGSISQLNETIFSNITASNNKTIGFLVSGNTTDPLSPITLNINRLVANNNLSGGFEGYSISGNLSSLELNANGIYGMKTSIGNAVTTIDGITALMNNVAGTSAAIGILSATNYYPTIIKNANVGKSTGSSTFGAGISLDSTKFSEFCVENSTVSGGSTDFQIRTTRNVLEGSYLIKKTNVGTLPVGIGVTSSNYQSDVLKTTGFAFTNMNNTSGYHVTYLAAGNRSVDTTVNINEASSPSERLTPQSTTLKLRSGSKFVALNNGQSTTINVYVRKSTVASNGVAYNGSAPRLILKRNGAMGIDGDIVMDQLDTTSEDFLKLSGVTPAVTDNGVLEFYVDCDGTQGWINIDNWSAN